MKSDEGMQVSRRRVLILAKSPQCVTFVARPSAALCVLDGAPEPEFDEAVCVEIACLDQAAKRHARADPPLTARAWWRCVGLYTSGKSAAA